VPRADLGAGRSLLDVPATVCWALGVAQPESYAGTPLSGWYAAARGAAPVAA
jgi:hypothetical protein